MELPKNGIVNPWLWTGYGESGLIVGDRLYPVRLMLPEVGKSEWAAVTRRIVKDGFNAYIIYSYTGAATSPIVASEENAVDWEA